MKKSGRRILSIILTAVMVFALLPVFGKPIVVKADDVQEHNHNNWTEISTWTELKSLGEDGGSGYLVDNIDISETFWIWPGKTVNLCLNGYSITKTADYDTIIVFGTFNLYDESKKPGKITHASTKTGIGVNIDNYGTFTMNGGTISGNNANFYGGGVYNSGTFTMNGGTISGNNAGYDGGGVYNTNIGTFEMNGGTISGNNASYGGGVENLGTFTMTEGTISGNEAYYGGGVYNDYGTFTMTEGTISGNNARKFGGGVDNYGTFTMEGGTIKENKAEKKGADVYVEETFIKENGNIEDSIEGPEGVCTVTFNANDGSNNTITQYVRPDVDTNLYPNKFRIKGKKFACWKTESGDKKYDDKESIIISENLILNAQWVECATISYVVTFKINNGSWSNESTNVNEIEYWRNENEYLTLVLKASDIPTPSNPDTGYKGSWDNVPDTVNELTENKTYTYTFEPIEYTVKFDANGGVGTMLDQDRKYDDKAPLTANTFTLEGYTFKGWNTAADGSGTSYADKNDSNLSSTDGETVKLFAQWQANKYTVNYDANGGTGTMDNQSRKYDDKVALTANAFTYEGRTFDCWNTVADGSGTPYKDEEISNLSSTDGETVTLYAQWTTDTFTISWKNHDGTVLETDTDVAYGSTPSYDGETPVRAKEGNKVYTFSGWTPEIDTVKGAATYTATYSEEVVEQTEPETPQNPTEPETTEEPEEELPEKDWFDDLRLALNIAAEPDSEKTIEYRGDFALPYEIMNFLVNHPDITFVYHVTYEGQEYTITIPAGKAVAYADTPWYGPLWLLANYGGNNAPTGAKGNGTYIVKAGDTLTGISVKLGVTIQYLVDKNGIKNPDYIVEGQELIY